MFNVIDEYGKLIDENVTLKRAIETVRLNPGAKMTPPTQKGTKNGNDLHQKH